MSNQNGFTTSLQDWNRSSNTREMPWKGEKDPYRIWLSEVILQQTRVEQGQAYYERFIAKYPSVCDLANAPDDDVFKLWEGLGYYTRCRNLLVTARTIRDTYEGVFPSSYAQILALKGVGSYTAAAIGSFAFSLPHAVVDGNVLRVLSRFTGTSLAVDTTEGKKYFFELANSWLDKKKPAEWNQAIMDFGAVVCTPHAPLCKECPMQENCVAFNTNTTGMFPVKSRKLIKKSRYFNYIAARWQDKVYVRKRTGKDIWKDLYEFILVETDKDTEPEELLKMPSVKGLRIRKSSVLTSPRVKQELSHQTVFIRVISVELTQKPEPGDGYMAMGKKELERCALPVTLKRIAGSKHFFIFP